MIIKFEVSGSLNESHKIGSECDTNGCGSLTEHLSVDQWIVFLKYLFIVVTSLFVPGN